MMLNFNKLNFIILTMFFIFYPLSSLYYFDLKFFGERNILFIISITFLCLNFINFYFIEKIDSHIEDKFLSIFLFITVTLTILNPKEDFFNKDVLSILGYSLLYIFCKNIDISEKQLKTILLIGIMFSSIMIFLSLSDYFLAFLSLLYKSNFFGFSFLNADISVTGDSFSGNKLLIMTGMFDSRTKFSIFLLIQIFVVNFILFNFKFEKLIRLFLLFSLFIMLISLLLTFSLGSLITLIITYLIFFFLHCTNENPKFSNLYLNLRLKIKKKYWFSILIILLIVITTHTFFFFDMSSQRSFVRTDVLIQFFNGEMKDLLFGSSTSKIFIEGLGYYGLHSTLGTILGISGIAGLSIFIMFLSTYFYKLYISQNFLFKYWSLSMPIISWLAFGVLHNLIHCSIVWVLMGLVFNKNFKIQNELAKKKST